MLILTRRVSESIVIDGRIVVTVVQLDRSAVKLGVMAPPNVAIHRKEVHDAIQRGDPVPPRTQRKGAGKQSVDDEVFPSEWEP